MFNVKISLFSRAKTLENKIDVFHDKVIDAAMTFNKSMHVYLSEGRCEAFKKVNKQLKQIEHDADQLRREIESRLYSQNLIPDLRGNVLELVENLDINGSESGKSAVGHLYGCPLPQRSRRHSLSIYAGQLGIDEG